MCRGVRCVCRAHSLPGNAAHSPAYSRGSKEPRISAHVAAALMRGVEGGGLGWGRSRLVWLGLCVTVERGDVCRPTTGPPTTIGAAPATSGTTSTPATGVPRICLRAAAPCVDLQREGGNPRGNSPVRGSSAQRLLACFGACASRQAVLAFPQTGSVFLCMPCSVFGGSSGPTAAGKRPCGARTPTVWGCPLTPPRHVLAGKWYARPCCRRWVGCGHLVEAPGGRRVCAWEIRSSIKRSFGTQPSFVVMLSVQRAAGAYPSDC